MGDLLKVSNLKQYFNVKSSDSNESIKLKAVEDVSFSIKEGETLGLVGESGCGKSTIAKCLVRLYDPTDGKIEFDGSDITHITAKEMRPYRKNIQMIFQDPYSSLDPRMNVENLICEGLKVHKVCKTKAEYRQKVIELMKQVGLSEQHLLRYPHEFSGGQRQRIAIAKALAVNPKLIICDEPVSALDVSIQAQVVNLLQELKEKHNMTYLFVSHDLRIVKHLSDRIAVMYLGSMMETATKKDLFAKPLHPYTQALLSAVPGTDPEKISEKSPMGEIPSIENMPVGCKFCTRCSQATERCHTERPVLKEVEKEHFVACHLYDKMEEK